MLACNVMVTNNKNWFKKNIVRMAEEVPFSVIIRYQLASKEKRLRNNCMHRHFSCFKIHPIVFRPRYEILIHHCSVAKKGNTYTHPYKYYICGVWGVMFLSLPPPRRRRSETFSAK